MKLFMGLVVIGVFVAGVVDKALEVLNRRKKKVADREQFKRELQEKLERKRREFEEFKEYIENCPQPEDVEVAENLNIEFDWDNISFIERMTVDDIVMNVNDKLLENGCRVDYRNIALHTLRNPFPSFN